MWRMGLRWASHIPGLGSRVLWAVTPRFRAGSRPKLPRGQPGRRHHLRGAAEERHAAEAPGGATAWGGGAALARVRESDAHPVTATRLRVPRADRVPLQPGAGHALGRGRIPSGDLDGAGSADEGEARAPCAAVAPRAVAILDDASDLDDRSGLVFPSPIGCTLSDSTKSKLLRELDVAAVPHGSGTASGTGGVAVLRRAARGL